MGGENRKDEEPENNSAVQPDGKCGYVLSVVHSEWLSQSYLIQLIGKEFFRKTIQRITMLERSIGVTVSPGRASRLRWSLLYSNRRRNPMHRIVSIFLLFSLAACVTGQTPK